MRADAAAAVKLLQRSCGGVAAAVGSAGLLLALSFGAMGCALNASQVQSALGSGNCARQSYL